MQKDEVWAAVDQQRAELADLASGFTADQWTTPSLCGEWTVRDVVAHLTLSDVSPLVATRELVRYRGNLNRMIRETARRRAGELDDRQLVDALRAMVGNRGHPIGTKYVDPLVDLLVHGQDVTVPLGIDRPMPADAAVAAAQRVATMGYWSGARKRLRGLRLEATDVEWSSGSGTTVRGPIAALLLLLAGRNVRLDELEGLPAGVL
jgi:uncharacterized protein (TIGR03083 family)